MLNIKKLSILSLACVMLTTCVLTACNNSEKSKNSGKTTHLTWYLSASKPKNADNVVAKANEYTKEKLNIEVDYKFIDPGNYDQKMNLLMSSGEEFDICWTSNWRNDYEKAARNGAYLALDEYLDKYPGLKATLPEIVLKGSKVNGKLYGIYCYQGLALPKAMWFKKDLVEKYNIDLGSIKSYAGLSTIYDLIKQKEANVVPVKFGDGSAMLMAEAGREFEIKNKFMINTDTWKVEDYITLSDEVFPYYELMRNWYLKGYFPNNVATVSEADTALQKAGNLFSCLTNYKPGIETELKQILGFDVIVKTMMDKPNKVDKIHGTLNAISQTSKNPEKALELLQLVNTDKELYNLLVFGIEGQDYQKLDGEFIKKAADSYKIDAWMLGNQFNAYLVQGQPQKAWEETKKINDTVERYLLADFDFDTSTVESALAQISAVDNEYKVILKDGLEDPAKIVKEYGYKLKQSGLETIKAELQKQLDDWIAKK